MKRLLTLVLTIAVLASFTAIPAAAANYGHAADDLNYLGLFLGTDKGYELDAVPTRAQAGVMLIRLLGQEQAALTGTYTHPFTDVPTWADKYVGYLYAKGLTKGISETEFGAGLDCDVRMYTTFVLRALGYSDTVGDFLYEDAVGFGAKVGVVDEVLAFGEFLRDDMVAMSLLALKAQPANKSSATLLHTLVKDGAVSAEAAQPLLDRFAAYDEIVAAVAAYNREKTIDAKTHVIYNLYISDRYEEIYTDADNSVAIKTINNDNEVLFSLEVNSNISYSKNEVFSTAFEMYYKDGVLYINANENDTVEKVKGEMDCEPILEELVYQELNAIPFYHIGVIEITYDAGDTIYTFNNVVSGINDWLNTSAIDIPPEYNLELDTKIEMTYRCVIHSDGSLSKFESEVYIEFNVKAEGEVGIILFKLISNTEVFATGDDVVIVFPDDLDEYVWAELYGTMSASLAGMK